MIVMYYVSLQSSFIQIIYKTKLMINPDDFITNHYCCSLAQNVLVLRNNAPKLTKQHTPTLTLPDHLLLLLATKNLVGAIK